MKRFMYLIICCFAFTASSQVSVGLKLSSDLQNVTIKTDAPNATENSNSNFDLSLGPVVRFLLSPKVEISPDIGFMVQNTSQKNPNGDTSSSNNNGLFVGCGFYFFLAANSVFKFSLGPRVYSDLWFSRTDMTFGAQMPLNFDIELSGPWSIRASASVINVWYSYVKAGGAAQSSFDYTIMSLFMPELSFFVTF